MVHQLVAQRINIVELIFANEREGRNNRYSIIPQKWTFCQSIEDVARFVEQVFAHDSIARAVYQIPIIDALSVCKIEIKKLFTQHIISLFKLLFQYG